MTVNKNRGFVLIVGNFEFPDGNAAGKRVLGIGLIFKQLGFQPVFVGVDKTLPANHNIEETRREGYGMSAYCLSYPQGLFGWMNYQKPFENTLNVIQEIGKENIAAFVAYGNPCVSILMNKFRKWCRENDIFFIADCVDWIEFSEKGFVHNIIKFLDTNFQKRYVIARADAVIAISRYLYEFYSKTTRNVMLLPPVTDVRLNRDEVLRSLEKYNLAGGSDRRKSFVYAGSPFWINPDSTPDTFKDRLDRTVELFYKVFQKTDRFTFDIYGITKEEYLIVLPRHQKMLDEMVAHVIFHGNYAIKELERRIINADFSVLHRDDNLVTQAGFPTKVSESVSLGVPVITEKTSNIVDYIITGYNGILITPENEQESLLEIIKFDNGQVLKMKMNCIQDEIFDYRRFVTTFEENIGTAKIRTVVAN